MRGGRKVFQHIYFQPDQCSNRFCPTATLILAPTERRWQQKCERRTHCFQPGTGFLPACSPCKVPVAQAESTGKSQEVWRLARALNKTETFLAPPGNSWCKIVRVNLGSILPLNNDTAELGKDQKYLQIVKEASKRQFNL